MTIDSYKSLETFFKHWKHVSVKVEHIHQCLAWCEKNIGQKNLYWQHDGEHNREYMFYFFRQEDATMFALTFVGKPI